MDKFHLVVIGGSAGGLTALRQVLSRLPVDLNAAICVVLHISPESPGFVPEILRKAGPLPAKAAVSGERIVRGQVYVAPPDRHLLVRNAGAIVLGAGPKENLFRPAIDPLFRSAAKYGRRAIGIILSGGLDDGAAGLAALKAAGGVAIVQDPNDATAPSMPRAALRATEVDFCLPAGAIAERLIALTTLAAPAEAPMPKSVNDIETDIAEGVSPQQANLASVAKPSLFTCPNCSGVLMEHLDPPLRFRCHTGHAFGPQTLLSLLAEEAEASLWSALRTFQEYEMLLRRLSSDASGGLDIGPELKRAERLAATLHDLLESESARRDDPGVATEAKTGAD